MKMTLKIVAALVVVAGVSGSTYWLTSQSYGDKISSLQAELAKAQKDFSNAQARADDAEKRFSEAVGKIADAEEKLEFGQPFDSMTSVAGNNANGWVGIMLTKGEPTALRFKEQPPKHGVMAQKNGKIVFLPVGPMPMSQDALADATPQQHSNSQHPK